MFVLVLKCGGGKGVKEAPCSWGVLGMGLGGCVEGLCRGCCDGLCDDGVGGCGDEAVARCGCVAVVFCEGAYAAGGAEGGEDRREDADEDLEDELDRFFFVVHVAMVLVE